METVQNFLLTLQDNNFSDKSGSICGLFTKGRLNSTDCAFTVYSSARFWLKTYHSTKFIQKINKG